MPRRWLTPTGTADRTAKKLRSESALRWRLSQPRSLHFDVIFIDADKTNYVAYYRRGLELLSPQGVILIDNVLWSGEVLKTGSQDPSTAAIQSQPDGGLRSARHRRSAHPARRSVYDYAESGKIIDRPWLPLKQFHLAGLGIVTDGELAFHDLK